jgi:hypothetical protein
MKENMELINQIATLRREVTLLNSQLRNQDCKLNILNYPNTNLTNPLSYSETLGDIEPGPAGLPDEWRDRRLGHRGQADAESDGDELELREYVVAHVGLADEEAIHRRAEEEAEHTRRRE